MRFDTACKPSLLSDRTGSILPDFARTNLLLWLTLGEVDGIPRVPGETVSAGGGVFPPSFQGFFRCVVNYALDMADSLSKIPFSLIFCLITRAPTAQSQSSVFGACLLDGFRW